MSDEHKIAIYLRVSTTDQSCELQQREIEQFIKAKNWTVTHIFQDKATGTNGNRSELIAMLKAAKVGHIDTIICWKLDRLFRSLKDLVNTLHSLSEMNIDFISIKDQIDMTTPSGRLMTHLLAAFAEFEASMIRERVRAGIANARAKGQVLGRPRQISPSLVYELRKAGLSMSQIAKQVGCSKSAISKTLKKIEDTKLLKNPENTTSGKDGASVE